MKTYNQTNFFKHTFCEFTQIDDFQFPEYSNYKSKSESAYFYTDEGVYRKSNHWGRVANCRWRIIADENYKNQQTVVGFAKWSGFHPINSNEKNFFISVDFKLQTATLQSKKENTSNYVFTFSKAQKRIKQIHHLFKDNKWTQYFDLETDELHFKVITEFINSDKTLQQIKRQFR